MAQIKKDTSLRKAILQAAITGQLISSCHSELDSESAETGKELLDKIIEERNNKLLAEWELALKKNSKAKKPATIVASEIDEEEIPFDIPENWCWCRLGDICLVKGGKRIPAGCTLTDVDTGHKYIRVADMKNGSVIVNNVKYITDEIHEKIKAYKISKDDVYITVAGTIGDSGIIPDELDNANLTENADKLVLFNGIDKYCLHFFLSSGFFQEQISDAITKVGQPKLAIIRIQNFLLPLPPLAVQNAIVAKLEQVLPLVDDYENAILQKEELKSALPAKIKKAILQEAITGQLTEVWQKSATIKESGKQLLDRIIEERNAKEKMSHGLDFANAKSGKKKTKKETALAGSNPCGNIPEDEIPFEVPESWCWCRLGDLGNFVRGSGIKRDETRPEGFPCIRYGEMYTKYKTVINETVSFVEKNVFDKCQKIIKNDIAMALTGENEYDIALAAVYTGDKEVAMGGDMTRFRPAFVNSLFLVFALNSPYGIECKSELATGNIIVHISNDKLGSIMIPLPPLEEQEEIVKKVEELLPLCK